MAAIKVPTSNHSGFQLNLSTKGRRMFSHARRNKWRWAAACLIGLEIFAVTDGKRTSAAETIFTDDVRIKRVVVPTLSLEQTDVSAPFTWQMLCTVDGAFKLTDRTNNNNSSPFVVESGAPYVTLYIEESGEVGIGTNNPQRRLHVQDDLFATMRFEARGVGGIPSYSWDIDGASSGFTITDVDGGHVPVMVEADTPDYMLYLSQQGGGHMGVGTGSPHLINNINVSGNSRHLNLTTATGTARAIVQGKDAAESFLIHTGGQTNRKIVRTRVAGGKYLLSAMSDNLASNIEHPFCVDLTTTNVGIKTSAPTKPLQVGDVGANDGNGAHVTAGGVWTNASSRTVKDDIQPVSVDTARDTIRALQPVTYHYKNERDEQYVGFIAEDVPDLVATNDRKSLASMDITAVLTRVVQDQDRQLDEQRQTISQLIQRLADLEQKVGSAADPTK